MTEEQVLNQILNDRGKDEITKDVILEMLHEAFISGFNFGQDDALKEIGKNYHPNER